MKTVDPSLPYRHEYSEFVDVKRLLMLGRDAIVPRKNNGLEHRDVRSSNSGVLRARAPQEINHAVCVFGDTNQCE